MTASVTGIFYDRQAFDDAGLPYPIPGWTWDEFRQNVIALASNPNTGPKYGFTDSLNFDHSILAPLVDAHLANSMGDFDIELLANDIHWYVDFVRQDAIYAAWENNDYALALKNWQALYGNDARPAMWAGNLASPMPGNAFPATKLAITSEGFAPFPMYENELNSFGASPIWVRCVGISAGTAHPRAAWEWVKFLSQNWVNDSSLIGGNLPVPARPSVADHFNYWGNLPPGIEPAVRFALEHAWYGSHYTEVINQISEGLSNAMRGNMDIFSAIDLAKTQIGSLPKATEISARREVSIQPVATPLPTLSADIITVNFFFGSYDKRDQRALEELAAEFSQAHSDIRVRISNDFRGEAGQESITTLANQFDCFAWNAPAWTIQSPDDLLNLSPLVEQEPVDFKMDYFENVLNIYKDT